MKAARIFNSFLSALLFALLGACGIVGGPTAQVSISLDPDSSMMETNSADIFDLLPIGLFGGGISATFKGTSFRNSLAVDTNFRLVQENFCYIAHVVDLNNPTFIHTPLTDKLNSDSDQELQYSGRFFGPAPYGSSIQIRVPPTTSAHIELLGFEVDEGSEAAPCSKDLLVYKMGQIPAEGQRSFDAKPEIRYNNKPISYPSSANPEGGLYKFYGTDKNKPISLAEGPNNVELSYFDWSDGWEEDSILPPRFWAGEEMRAIKPHVSHGAPVPLVFPTGLSGDDNFNSSETNVSQVLNIIKYIDGFENPDSTNFFTASPLEVECTNGANQVQFVTIDLPSSYSSAPSLLKETELVDCAQSAEDLQKPFSSKYLRTAIFYSQIDSRPASLDAGDSRLIIAIPVYDNGTTRVPLRKHRRFWKFDIPGI